jgi:hypothetical protein
LHVAFEKHHLIAEHPARAKRPRHFAQGAFGYAQVGGDGLGRVDGRQGRWSVHATPCSFATIAAARNSDAVKAARVMGSRP